MLQKGKGKKGKGVDKGKGKQKGFGDKGKGKGKASEKGKGKGQSRPYDAQKGQQKGYGSYNSGGQQQKSRLDVNVCAYCGKQGHWQRDCTKRQADQQSQVRVVGATDSVDPKQDTQSTAASFSIGSWFSGSSFSVHACFKS